MSECGVPRAVVVEMSDAVQMFSRGFAFSSVGLSEESASVDHWEDVPSALASIDHGGILLSTIA